MSLTSYRAAPPRDGCSRCSLGTDRFRQLACRVLGWPTGSGMSLFCPVWLVLPVGKVWLRELSLVRFGGDLLSHVLRRSTIGATALNGRVREGIGCFARAMTTKPKERQAAVAPVSTGRTAATSGCSKSGGKCLRNCRHVAFDIFP